MTVESDILGAKRLKEEVDETIAHLKNGAGHVPGCPGHEWLAKGVVLCLQMLSIQSGTTRRHVTATAFATFLAVLASVLLERITQ